MTVTPSRPLLIGNWKMNGLRKSLCDARAIDRLAGLYPAVEVGLAPPFTLIAPMAPVLHHVALGAQDCHQHDCGPYTGDISGAMLYDAGARFVLLGHSERRQHHSETDKLIRAKIGAAQNASLTTVVCVGETLTQHQAGLASQVVAQQLRVVLADKALMPSQLVVAYEPVWAIGSGLIPTGDHIGAIHALIRSELRAICGPVASQVRLLYGGSVSPKNARSLLELDAVDGLLIGGASLDYASFHDIMASLSDMFDAIDSRLQT